MPHQVKAFERFRDASEIPLWWQQRCRKTSVILDIFRYRYHRGDLDALLVFADPKGVESTWLDEIAEDFPPEDLAATRVLLWQSGYTTGSKARREEALSLRDHPGPVVIVFYCGALITDKGWGYVEWLLRKRRALVVADEASWMCNWNARTRRMLALGGFYKKAPRDVGLAAGTPRNVVVKAVLDGTPVDEGPDDVYYPLQFLRKDNLGFTSPAVFRERYHRYKTETSIEIAEDGTRMERERLVMGKNHSQMTFNRTTKEWEPSEYPIFDGYQNLDELTRLLSKYGSRVLRSDVSNAPPATHDVWEFDLSPRQLDVYGQAQREYVAELSQGTWGLDDVLKRMTRLQQIARNYFPPEKVGTPCAKCAARGTLAHGEECEACEGTGAIITYSSLEKIDPGTSPSSDALVSRLRESTGPTVVWCRFRQDVTDAIDAAASDGVRLLRYDGVISAQEREANYRAFRAGEGDGICGVVTSGLSRGKNLTRATDMVFYSNWFGRRPRSQAQDRCEALDRTISTRITDLVARDTRDADAVRMLLEKGERAALVMGDARRMFGG